MIQIIIVLAALQAALTVPNTAFDPNVNSYSCVTTIPSAPCTAYCMYTVDSSYNLASMCSSNQIRNGGCTACQSSLFTLIAGFCIPHLINSQAEQAYFNYHAGTNTPTSGVDTHLLGYHLGTTTSNFQMRQEVTNLQPHFAVRIRFGIYLINNQRSTYYYPLYYALDTSIYSYNQVNLNYYSCWDIITSPLKAHFNSSLTIAFSNNNQSLPVNTHGCTSCDCNTCPSIFCCGCGCSTGCCQDRYIQIRDILVFASLCPDFCLTCTSASACNACWTGFYLNEADRLCYSSCPQATYTNSTMYLAGNASSGTYTSTSGTTYTEVYQAFCVPCDPLCMECINSTQCTRCYTIGRNQSYLFNNTCVLAPCPNGFFANMTNHTCDCPEDYYYPTISADFITMLCTRCAFQCVRCSGPTNLECSVCEAGFFLANGTTFCLSKCPDGEYIHPYMLNCHLCDISCSTCSYEASNCTGCTTKTDRYLFGNRCFTNCPPGYSWNNISRTCDLCDYYSYSYLGTCVTVCPAFYKASLENRSCISYAATGFTFSLVLEQVHVLEHGKLLQYVILAEDGLNISSQNWMKHHSYEGVQILYKDTLAQDFIGVRSLANTTLTIRNINYQNNRIIYTTNLPGSFDYHKSFQVVFLQSISGQKDIPYGNQTTVFQIRQNPQLMKEYFLYAVTNYYNLILLPFMLSMLFLILLQVKGTYQLMIETIRIIQVLGLLVYVAYPVGENSFFFLLGCSYANLDFIPNIYAKLAKTSSNAYLNSYQLAVTDMDFVRLVGSIILFGVVMLVVYLIARCLLKVKQSKLDFITRFGIDLLEVKVMHSFWTSFIYIVINYKAAQFGMIAVFLLALCMVTALVARRYTLYVQTLDFSFLFVWRVIACLLICFIAMANQLTLALLVLSGLIATACEFVNLHSQRYKVSINDLSSSNYMDERTIRVLNDYDIQVKYSFSISLRNTLIIVCPIVTAFVSSVLILLRDQELYSVSLAVAVVYLMELLAIVNLILVFLFLEERRKFLVQSKLEYLQKKYSKVGQKETILYEERRRPRVMSTHYNFEEDKYEEKLANRSMMKSFD